MKSQADPGWHRVRTPPSPSLNAIRFESATGSAWGKWREEGTIQRNFDSGKSHEDV